MTVPGTAIPSIPRKSSASDPRRTFRITNQAMSIPKIPARGVANRARNVVAFTAALAKPPSKYRKCSRVKLFSTPIIFTNAPRTTVA